MGNEGQNDAAGLLGTVLSRLGGEPESRHETLAGADAEQSDAAPASDDRRDGRPLTDGGAEDAPIGDSPWAEDDPIVFGDDADTDHGAALLDAVTDATAADETAPPFSESASDGAGATADGQRESSPSDVESSQLDPERLDELEARIGALESDHVQLEVTIADLAEATSGLQSEVEAVGTDVGQLVAMLGGLAVASAQSDTTEADVGGSAPTPEEAEALESRIDEAVEAAVESVVQETVEDAIAEFGETVAADVTSTDRDQTAVTDDEAPSGDPASASDGSAEDAVEDPDAATFDVDGVPEGIHRGAGTVPTTDDGSEADVEEAAAEDGQADVGEPAPSAVLDAEESGAPPADSAVAHGEASQGTEEPVRDVEELDRDTDEPSRELVDPRTEAVGARLRQFREGFVDDPTADLPTGNTADEFRFEKILLPTDGAAAPDLSADELAKPYLETLPDGYAADAVVLEWLDWLVSAADSATAAHAVGYYESIDWLTEDVRADLLGYLDGLGQIDGAADSYSVDEPPEALDLQDHLRSLQYVTELASGEVGADGV